MTFDVLEESNYSSVPAKLYLFARGSQHWRYTDSDTDITIQERFAGFYQYLGQPRVYTAFPISDGGVSLSGEPTQDQLVITLPWDTPVVALFLATPPSTPVTIAVSATHVGDPSTLPFDPAPDLAVRLLWVGTISQVRRTDPGKAEVTCSTVVHSLERNGLRLSWSRTCPYVLYDPKTCKVDRTLFSASGTVATLDAQTVTLAGIGVPTDDNYRGGFIEWVASAGDPSTGILDPAPLPVYERRNVAEQTGASFRLLGTTQGLSVGFAVTVYRGCNRLVTTCNDVFANIDNCGASPQMPGVSPFDGNPVF
jgi:uncharacterized phage protein (TIGR02218 family)